MSRSKFEPLKGKRIAFDTETTGLFPWHGDCPFALGFLNTEGDHVTVEWPVDPVTRKVIPDEKELERIGNWIDDADIDWILHHAKFDMRQMERNFGIMFNLYKVHDTQFMAHAVNSMEGGWIHGKKVRDGYKLKRLAWKYFKYPKDDEDELYDLVKQLRLKIGRLEPDWKLAFDYKVGKGGVIKKKGTPAADYWLPRAVLKHHPEVFATRRERKFARKACRRYLIGDVERTMLLDQMYQGAMDEREVRHIYDFEMRELFPVVWDMEARGVHISRKACKSEVEKCKGIMEELEPKIVKATWPGFNMDNHNHMRKLLYDVIGLPVKSRTKPSKLHPQGMPSTAFGRGAATEMLEKADHPAIRMIVKYRANNKAINSFFGRYLKLMLPDHIVKGEWCLHASHRQSETDTARFAMNDPNLQNVAGVGTSLGAEPIFAREPFGPRPGYVWIHIDYANMELRIFAHCAKEKIMCEIFRLERDIHTEATNRAWGGKGNHSGILEAMHVLGLDGSGMGDNDDVRKVWKKYGVKDPNKMKWKAREEICDRWMAEFDYDIVKAEKSVGNKSTRVKSKIVSFVRIFGGGAKAAAKQIRCSNQDAAKYMNDYARGFPRMLPYIKECKKFAEKHGYVLNAFKRRLTTDPERSYAAVNRVIQSTAADMLKRAMVRTWRLVKRISSDGKRIVNHSGIDCHLSMTIHDELVFEIKREECTKQLVRKLCNLMEDSEGRLHRVRMKVEPEIVVEKWRYKSALNY